MAAKKKAVAVMSPATMKMMEGAIEQEEAQMVANAETALTAMPRLVEAANELVNLVDALDGVEAKQKELSTRRDELRKHIIPDLMRKAGLVDSRNKGSFTVPGRKIFLETRVNASCTKENQAKLFAWLKKEKLGDMIKPTVNAQSLSALVRERRGEGKNVPSTVSVFEETVAKVTKT